MSAVDSSMGPAAGCVPTPLQPSAPLVWRELASLYRGEFAFVWRCVQRFGVPRSSADDATQDVFLRLFARWHTLDDRSLRGLLFVIARQVATDHHRRVRAPTEPVGEHEDAATLLPDELAGRREAATFLREFVESLDPEKRRVFVLAELEQCSAPEIARALEVPLGTVYSRHRAARLELDEALRRRRARERSASRMLEVARRSRPAPREGVLQRGWVILWIRLGEPRPPVLAAALSKPLLATLGQAIAGGVLAAGAVIVAATAISRDEPIAAIERQEIDDAPLAAAAVARVPIAVPPPAIASAIEEEPEIEILAAPSRSPARARSVAPTIAAPTPTSAPEPPLTPAEQLAAELRWIDGAEARLRADDPASALRMLDQHASKFPAGLLAPERRLARAHALCKLGRDDEARAEVRACVSRNPDLAKHPRARAGCSGAG